MTKLLESFSGKIKEKAIQLGFSACGIAEVGGLDEERVRLQKWLSEGMNASMT